VANTRDGTVTKIDARSGTVLTTTPVGTAPAGLVVGDDRVWLTIARP